MQMKMSDLVINRASTRMSSFPLYKTQEALISKTQVRKIYFMIKLYVKAPSYRWLVLNQSFQKKLWR